MTYRGPQHSNLYVTREPRPPERRRPRRSRSRDRGPQRFPGRSSDGSQAGSMRRRSRSRSRDRGPQRFPGRSSDGSHARSSRRRSHSRSRDRGHQRSAGRSSDGSQARPKSTAKPSQPAIDGRAAAIQLNKSIAQLDPNRSPNGTRPDEWHMRCRNEILGLWASRGGDFNNVVFATTLSRLGRLPPAHRRAVQEDSRFREIVSAIVDQNDRDSRWTGAREMSNMIHAAALFTGRDRDRLLESLVPTAASRVREFDPQNMANTVHGYYKAEFRAPLAPALFHAFAAEIQSRLTRNSDAQGFKTPIKHRLGVFWGECVERPT